MMMNPVLRREIKTALRSWKIFGALVLYVASMALGAGIFLYATMLDSYDFSFDPQSMIGLYVVLCAIQMGFIMMATPALTAGSISGERERQTLDLLLVTKMSAFSIVSGKLTASLGRILWMTIATLPVFSVVFYFGGVSLWSLFLMTVYILLTACTVGAVSVLCSCLFRKTTLSIVLVYLFFAVLCFGTLLMVAVHHTAYWQMYQTSPSIFIPLIFLAGNPGVGFFSIVDAQVGTDFVNEIINMYETKNTFLIWITEHYWVVNVVFDLVLIVICLFLATRYIYPVKEKRAKRKEKGKETVMEGPKEEKKPEDPA